MDRNKVEGFRYITKKVTDMKDNGKLIFKMAKEKLHIGMVQLIMVNLKTIINMERVRLMIFKIKKQYNKFIKMES